MVSTNETRSERILFEERERVVRLIGRAGDVRLIEGCAMKRLGLDMLDPIEPAAMKVANATSRAI